jgi:hypothetical protein
VPSPENIEALQTDSVPKLIATQLPIGTQVVYGGRCHATHTANVELDFLNTIFGPRVMSRRYPKRHNCGHSWLPFSPALNHRDLFLWGFVKEMFPINPRDVMEMRVMIILMCSETEEDIFRWVITDVRVYNARSC